MCATARSPADDRSAFVLTVEMPRVRNPSVGSRNAPGESLYSPTHGTDPMRTFLGGQLLEGPCPFTWNTHRKVKGVTAAAVAEAHAKDLHVQGKHGVNYRSYWVDEKTETIFCPVEAPSPEAAARVHKEAAHDLVADDIREVHQG